MNQQTTNQTPEPKRQCKGGLGRKARLGVAAAALIGIGALAGVLITNASAHNGFGGHGAWGSRDHHYHGASSIEKIRGRALDMAAWALGSVDATPEQSKRVKAIVLGLVEEIYPLGNNTMRIDAALKMYCLSHRSIGKPLSRFGKMRWESRPRSLKSLLLHSPMVRRC